ncbi:MAG TPA: DUF1330 domain-containing protein [Stellaceae bacterium]|nr:DUF1330 domain-containing protein [Stellaceae bacterium]
MTLTTDRYVSMAQVRDRAELARSIVGDGVVAMLNLLRFRAVADYSESPELAPEAPISGAEAYARYLELLKPRMIARGGEILFWGDSGPFLVGPEQECWDKVLIVRWPSLRMLAGSQSDSEYLAVAGHRTAALEDSRLLPIRQLQ